MGTLYIDGISKYIPSDFDVPTIKNLLAALLSGEERRIERAKGWLQKNLHPRAYEATPTLFKATAKGEAKEAKRLLTAVCQLHEYWGIDHVLDEDEAKLETLEQYEARMGLTVGDRGIMPECGYLGPLELAWEPRIKRLPLEVLGDEPPSDQGELPLTPAEEVKPEPIVEPTPEPQESPAIIAVYVLKADADVEKLKQAVGETGSGNHTIWVKLDGKIKAARNRRASTIPDEFVDAIVFTDEIGLGKGA